MVISKPKGVFIVWVLKSSPKLNFFCARKCTCMDLSSSLNCIWHRHNGIWSQWLIPQLTENIQKVVFQQDWSHTHYKSEVREFLNDTLQTVGLVALEMKTLLHPYDFFLWGYVKDKSVLPSYA